MMTLSNVLTVEISIRRFTAYWSIAPNQVVSLIANLRVERPASTYSESKLWILRSRLTGKFNKWAKLRWAVFFKFYSAVWSGPTCSHVLSQNNFRQGLVSKRKTHLLCFLLFVSWHVITLSPAHCLPILPNIIIPFFALFQCLPRFNWVGSNILPCMLCLVYYRTSFCVQISQFPICFEVTFGNYLREIHQNGRFNVTRHSWPIMTIASVTFGFGDSPLILGLGFLLVLFINIALSPYSVSKLQKIWVI